MKNAYLMEEIPKGKGILANAYRLINPNFRTKNEVFEAYKNQKKEYASLSENVEKLEKILEDSSLDNDRILTYNADLDHNLRIQTELVKDLRKELNSGNKYSNMEKQVEILKGELLKKEEKIGDLENHLENLYKKK